MCRALQALAVQPAHVLVDGNVVPKALGCAATAIVKGDLLCLSIAAASILAKVHRDALMVGYDTKFPGYAFGTHKGYSTPAHAVALRERGPCEIHRRSFEPVAAALLGRS
ncbi:MAG: ribonuclease HII, partial [Bdellovibrionota bacterium]